MGYEDKVSNDPKTFIKHVYCCAVAEVKHNKHEVGTAAAAVVLHISKDEAKSKSQQKSF